jgi:hypothetical protein
VAPEAGGRILGSQAAQAPPVTLTRDSEAVSWLFRPDQWPRTPQDWLQRASAWPTTPRQWLTVVDEISRSPTRVLVDLVESVSAGLVGRTVTIETANDTIELELVDVACSHDNPPIAMGALRPGRDIEGIESVVVRATDVRWDRGRLDHLRVEAHHVRLETGIVARMRSAPVEMEGRLGQSGVDDWVERMRRDTDADVMAIELFAPGVVRVRLRSWLEAEVAVRLAEDEAEVILEATRVQVRGVGIPFVHTRIPSRHIPVPPLAHGLRLTDLEVTDMEIIAHGRIDEVREPVWLDQVIRAASTVGSEAVLRLRPPDDSSSF